MSVDTSVSEFFCRQNEISVLGIGSLLVGQKSRCPPAQIRIFISRHLLFSADDIWRWLECWDPAFLQAKRMDPNELADRHMTRVFGQMIWFIGHVTRISGQMTKGFGHMTRVIGQVTWVIGHMTRVISHVTKVGHVTRVFAALRFHRWRTGECGSFFLDLQLLWEASDVSGMSVKFDL